MNYIEIGNDFVKNINEVLIKNKIKGSLVTGGGFAYESIKYRDGYYGDFDFMIVYDDVEQLNTILNDLKQIGFCYDDNYLNLDFKLLLDGSVDIIRLSGKYQNIKSTINLVPLYLIKKLINLEENVIIRKIAHERNTSLFFSYGSDKSRITVNFFSPSFITNDGKDHYIHLDFSTIKRNDNLYFGILSDAILKGFNMNYDTIDFQKLRKIMIKNIHHFFQEKNIPDSNYLNVFANNLYFSKRVKDLLYDEFVRNGNIKGNESGFNEQKPIFFTSPPLLDFECKPFNFKNNKEFKMMYSDYICEMQESEYSRQYLIDSLGKLFGYLLFSNSENRKYTGNILEELKVYGVNDLYMENIENYSLQSIINKIIEELNNDKFNVFIKRELISLCKEFLLWRNNHCNQIDIDDKSIIKERK